MFLRVRIVAGVVVVFDCDLRELFLRRAELVHVAHDHHRIVAVVVAADREIKIGVRGQCDELIALRGLDVAHRLETHRRDDFVPAARDRFPRLLETQPAGSAAAFDAHVRFRAKADVILHHRAGFELPGEMIGKIRDDAAVDVVDREFAAEIGERVIEGLLDHQPEIFIGVRFRKLRNPARDHVDRSSHASLSQYFADR